MRSLEIIYSNHRQRMADIRTDGDNDDRLECYDMCKKHVMHLSRIINCLSLIMQHNFV